MTPRGQQQTYGCQSWPLPFEEEKYERMYVSRNIAKRMTTRMPNPRTRSWCCSPAGINGGIASRSSIKECIAIQHTRFPRSDRKSGHRQPVCLLYPQKRTCAVHWSMSAIGHKRTSPIFKKYLRSPGGNFLRRWPVRYRNYGLPQVCWC